MKYKKTVDWITATESTLDYVGTYSIMIFFYFILWFN